MTIPLAIVLILVFVLIALTLYERVCVRRAAREAADETEGRERNPPRYIPANPKDFTWLDQIFYDRAANELSRLGFRFIADMENTTESALTPYLRRFSRVLLNKDGTIIASIVMIAPHRREMPWRLRWIPVTPARLINFSTKTADSIRLETNNTRGVAAELPDLPGCVMQIFNPDTPIDVLLRHHESAIAEILEAEPDLQFQRFLSWRDVQEEAQNEHEWLKACDGYNQISLASTDFVGRKDPDLKEASGLIKQAYKRERHRRAQIHQAMKQGPGR